MIRVWNIPEADKDEKYPQTDGKNYCVGIWSDNVAEPYWQLQYHPFADLLLAIKSDKIIQVWDCKEIKEKVPSYDDKGKVEMSNQDTPMKEYEFKHEGSQSPPTCCSWLPTDSHLFVVGYKSSLVALFDYNSGKVESSHKFFPGDEEGEVVCLDAHEL